VRPHEPSSLLRHRYAAGKAVLGVDDAKRVRPECIESTGERHVLRNDEVEAVLALQFPELRRESGKKGLVDIALQESTSGQLSPRLPHGPAEVVGGIPDLAAFEAMEVRRAEKCDMRLRIEISHLPRWKEDEVHFVATLLARLDHVQGPDPVAAGCGVKGEW